jgi:sugar O-acyltransferase (sialic acid O-acetyltransferase NeuD family)
MGYDTGSVLPPLRIAGAGGHAKVVVDALKNRDPHRAVVVSDDRAINGSTTLLGLPVVAPLLDPSVPQGQPIHVALGRNRLRQKISLEAERLGFVLESVLHPAACIAATASVGTGTLLAARAVVGPDARVGRGCIVNHGAIVDHDCTVGDWAHIAPGVVLSGEVVVEEGAMVGAGAIVLPGCRIGAWAVVGAGAVVTRDVGENHCVVGVPAKIMCRGNDE